MDFLEDIFERFGRKKQYGRDDHNEHVHHDDHERHHDRHQWGGAMSDARTSGHQEKGVQAGACCGATLPEQARFCPQCGTTVQRPSFCSKCGLQIQDGANFCHGCGQGLR